MDNAGPGMVFDPAFAADGGFGAPSGQAAQGDGKTPGPPLQNLMGANSNNLFAGVGSPPQA